MWTFVYIKICVLVEEEENPPAQQKLQNEDGDGAPTQLTDQKISSGVEKGSTLY